MAQDRMESDELHVTHEFLAVMLGVRRPGVTEALHRLEGEKLIRSHRGVVLVRNRAGLEALADGSYGVPEDEYTRLCAPLLSKQSAEYGLGSRATVAA
jgi:hypothetical protein